MDLWLIVIIAVIVIAVTASITWLIARRVPIESSSPPTDRAPEQLDLTMAVIGFDGSGKTVYVASMYNELKAPGRHPICLSAGEKDRRTLRDIYRLTADTSAGWPRGTAPGEMTEYLFTVKVRGSEVGRFTEVARIRYLDFAGETFRAAYSGSSNPALRQFRERLEEADVLMGMLDGQQVKRFLKDGLDPEFHDELVAILDKLADHEQPVNLILSKWDLLHGFDFSYVVDQLFEIEEFEKFVESRRGHGDCRLIPVSSLGYTFAQEDDYGVIVKTPDDMPSPHLVEVPMARVLLDAAMAAENGGPDSVKVRKIRKWIADVSLSIPIGILKLNVYRNRQDTQPEKPRKLVFGAKFYVFCAERAQALKHTFPASDLVSFLDARRSRPRPALEPESAAALAPVPVPAAANGRRGWFKRIRNKP